MLFLLQTTYDLLKDLLYNNSFKSKGYCSIRICKYDITLPFASMETHQNASWMNNIASILKIGYTTWS